MAFGEFLKALVPAPKYPGSMKDSWTVKKPPYTLNCSAAFGYFYTP